MKCNAVLNLDAVADSWSLMPGHSGEGHPFVFGHPKALRSVPDCILKRYSVAILEISWWINSAF